MSAELWPGQEEWRRNWQRKEREVLNPIREECGYPRVDDDDEALWDIDGEVIMEYIASLERALVAQYTARDLMRRV